MKKKQVKVSLYVILLILVTVGVYFLNEQRLFKIREKKYDSIIMEAAARHKVPPTLIKAVIKRESKFKEAARGGHGEYGLMQITPGAADDWIKAERKKKFEGYSQLLTPRLNIEIGTWYLAQGLKKYHNYKYRNALALARYNAGPTNVIKNKWVPSHKDGEVLKLVSFPSTKEYIKAILKFEKQYAKKGFGK